VALAQPEALALALPVAEAHCVPRALSVSCEGVPVCEGQAEAELLGQAVAESEGGALGLSGALGEAEAEPPPVPLACPVAETVREACSVLVALSQKLSVGVTETVLVARAVALEQGLARGEAEVLTDHETVGLPEEVAQLLAVAEAQPLRAAEAVREKVGDTVTVALPQKLDDCVAAPEGLPSAVVLGVSVADAVPLLLAVPLAAGLALTVPEVVAFLVTVEAPDAVAQ
jgi:hypothetical protein